MAADWRVLVLSFREDSHEGLEVCMLIGGLLLKVARHFSSSLNWANGFQPKILCGFQWVVFGRVNSMPGLFIHYNNRVIAIEPIMQAVALSDRVDIPLVWPIDMHHSSLVCQFDVIRVTHLRNVLMDKINLILLCLVKSFRCFNIVIFKILRNMSCSRSFSKILNSSFSNDRSLVIDVIWHRHLTVHHHLTLHARIKALKLRYNFLTFHLVIVVHLYRLLQIEWLFMDTNLRQLSAFPSFCLLLSTFFLCPGFIWKSCLNFIIDSLFFILVEPIIVFITHFTSDSKILFPKTCRISFEAKGFLRLLFRNLLILERHNLTCDLWLLFLRYHVQGFILMRHHHCVVQVGTSAFTTLGSRWLRFNLVCTLHLQTMVFTIWAI